MYETAKAEPIEPKFLESFPLLLEIVFATEYQDPGSDKPDDLILRKSWFKIFLQNQATYWAGGAEPLQNSDID